MDAKITSISRYDVRDSSNPMLNFSYKVDSYTEGQKDVLSLSGTTKLKSLELPLILDPNTIYIVNASSDEETTGRIDAGTDVTKSEHTLLGLKVLLYNDVAEGASSFTLCVTAHQHIKVDEGDVIANIKGEEED